MALVYKELLPYLQYLPSGITAPIASSGLKGAPIFRDTTKSSLVPSSDAMISPIMMPPRGIATTTVADLFFCALSSSCASLSHFSLLASSLAASILFLNITDCIFLCNKVGVNYNNFASDSYHSYLPSSTLVFQFHILH